MDKSDPTAFQWLPYYERRFERLSRGHRKLMGQISAATLDRLLAPARAEHVRARCGTKPGSLLRSEIPIRTGTQFWLHAPRFTDHTSYSAASVISCKKYSFVLFARFRGN